MSAGALELHASELDAVSGLHPDRRLSVSLPGADPQLEGRLRKLGFDRVAPTAQLVDLRPHDTFAAYLRALPGRRLGRRVERQLADLHAAGGVLEVVPCADAPLEAVRAFYADVFLPAAALIGVDPYGARAAERFSPMLVEPESWLLSCRVGGEWLGGAIWRATTVEGLTRRYAGGVAARLAWSQELGPHEPAVDLLFVYTAPAHRRERVGNVLYGAMLRWCIERRVRVFSGGLEPPVTDGQYLGVIEHKQAWGATTAALVSERRTYERLPALPWLAARESARYAVLDEGGPSLRFVLASGVLREPGAAALLGADPHLPVEIVVASERDAALARRLAAPRSTVRIATPHDVTFA